jgi:hypothetical protein
MTRVRALNLSRGNYKIATPIILTNRQPMDMLLPSKPASTAASLRRLQLESGPKLSKDLGFHTNHHNRVVGEKRR